MAATGPAFLCAALAVGWTFAEIVSASLNSSRIAKRVVRAAPSGVAAGLSACFMRTVDDPLGGAAAAANTTVRSTSGALGAGLAGVVVTLTVDDSLGGGGAARRLFAGFAVLTVIGMIDSFRTVGR